MRAVFSPEKISTRIVPWAENIEEGSEKCIGFIACGKGLKRGITSKKAVDGSGAYISLPDGLKPGSLCYIKTNYGERALAFSGGKIYVNNFDEKGFLLNDSLKYRGKVSFSKVYYAGKQCVLIADENGSGYLYDGTIFSLKKFGAGCQALVSGGNGCVFVSDTKAYLSLDGNATFDFYSDENSFSFGVDFGIKNAVRVGNEVLLVSESSLLKSSKGIFDGNLSINKLETGGARIFTKTLCACGDKAYALTDGGLLVYDGASVSFKYPELGETVKDGVFAFSCKGNAFITVKTSRFPSHITTFCFSDKDYYDTGLEIVCGDTRENGEFCYVENKKSSLCSIDGEIGTENCRAVYTSVPTDFGVDGEKTLAYVKANTNRSFLLTVEADGKKRKYVIKPHEGYVRPYVRGRSFIFSIESEYQDVKIASVLAEIEY